MKPKSKKVMPPKAVRGYQAHQLTPLLKAVKRNGLGALDQRSSLAKATGKLRSELVTDLGGEESLSVQQLKIVDEFLKRFVMLESIDAWIFRQPALMNKRTKSLFPIMIQRMTIGDGMLRCLRELGLERKAKQIPTVQDYINQAGSSQP
jgi:hypothetical protein